MANFRDIIIESRESGGGLGALNTRNTDMIYNPTEIDVGGVGASMVNTLEKNADVPQDSMYIVGKLARAIIFGNQVKGGGLGALHTRNKIGFLAKMGPYKDSNGNIVSGPISKLEIDSDTKTYPRALRINGNSIYDIPRQNFGHPTDKEMARDLMLVIGGINTKNPAAISDAVKGRAINKNGKFSLSKSTDGIDEMAKERITFYFEGNGIETSYSKLQLQFIPREVQFTMENRLIAIASPGRNTPFYHYTGSEDTLEFTIDWVSEDENNLKEDVISKCRWLESMSKNDGYLNKPAYVKIQWGKDGKLFRDTVWVIKKAPYKLQNFNKGFKDPTTQRFVGTSLLPIQAYQEITLKRVDSVNTLRKDILFTKSKNIITNK